MHGAERGGAVFDQVYFHLPTLQQLGNHNLVDAVIFRNQDSQSTERGKGALRCDRLQGGWRCCAHRAGDCQREGAASALHTGNDNRASKQACQIARDCQPQAGASVATRSGAIGLAERFKDQVAFCGRDADATIADCKFEIPQPLGCLFPGNAQADEAFGSELERVPQQIQEDLP